MQACDGSYGYVNNVLFDNIRLVFLMLLDGAVSMTVDLTHN